MLETLQYQEIALEGVKCEDWKCTANCSQASLTRSLVSQVKKKSLYYCEPWKIEKCGYTIGISYSIGFIGMRCCIITTQI